MAKMKADIFKKRDQEKLNAMFSETQKELARTYHAKNSDYGDSFNLEWDMFGATIYVQRLFEKTLRLMNVSENGAEVADEKIIDTIMDIAGYSIMAAMRYKFKEYFEEAEKPTLIEAFKETCLPSEAEKSVSGLIDAFSNLCGVPHMPKVVETHSDPAGHKGKAGPSSELSCYNCDLKSACKAEESYGCDGRYYLIEELSEETKKGEAEIAEACKRCQRESGCIAKYERGIKEYPRDCPWYSLEPSDVGAEDK